MAAGAYKGLTIRIGADTTRLSSALRGANSAIYKTQSELNKLNKAARLDPGNSNVVQMQIGALSAQATGAAAKFDMLNKSMEELGNQKASGSNQSIKELAEQTDNVALAAENAKDRYNAVDKELDSVYTSVKDLSGIDLGKATRESPEAYDKAVQKLREWASEAKNQDAVKAWSEANHTSIEGTISDIDHMKSVWSDASAQLNDAQLAQSFHNAQVEAAAMDAQINASARALSNIRADSAFATTSTAIERVDDKLKMLNAAADSASSRFERLDAASKMSPGNIGTMVERSRALADATEVARAKAAALSEKIATYKAGGVDQIAKGIVNMSDALERSKAAYVDTENEVARLAGEYDNAQKSFRALIDDSEKGGDFAKRFEDATNELNRLGQELDKAKAKRETALDNFDTVKMCSELRNAEDELIEVNARMDDLKRVNFGEVGAAAVQAAEQIGQLMRQAGSEIVESSNAIDASYRDLRKTFDASEEEYKSLYDAAMAYGQANVTSADTMLEMESIAAQLGVGLDEYGNKTANATEQIRRFAEVAANLDVATNIDSDTIALQMGQIQNVMDDLSPDNIESFGDALVRLGNTMPTQESNIMQITQRLAAVGSVTSFTTPQLMGWAAAIASTGQRSEAAATGISNTITAIQKAVGAGGDALDLFAETAHMDAESFAAAWRDSPTEALKAFISGLGNLGDEALQKLEDLDITGVRQTQTLLSLAKTVDTVDVAIQNATDAWNGGGDAAAEAGKKAEGFSGTLAKLQNSTQVLAATFGDAMVPWMNRGIDAVQRLTDWLGSLDDETVSTGVAIGGVFAGISVAAPIAGAIMDNTGKLIRGGLELAANAFVKLEKPVSQAVTAIGWFAKEGIAIEEVMVDASGATTAFGSVLAFLTTPLGVVVGAVGILAAALGGEYIAKTLQAKRESDAFRDAVDGITGATEGLGREMAIGGDAIEQYADKWSAARVNMDEYHKELQGHLDAMKDYRTGMSDTVGMFERYESIIGSAVGKGEHFAGNIGELQWAIDGLNEATGESWTMQDVLSGKYRDEEGAIHDTKDALEELIHTKEREAKINALESMLTENYKAQEENALQRQLASSAYQDWIDMKLKVREETGAFSDMDNGEYIKYLQQTDEHTQQLLMDNKNLRSEARLLTEQHDELANSLAGEINELEYATTAAYGDREAIMQTSDAMKEAIRSFMGFSDGEIDQGIKDIAQSLQDAGVSVESFAGLSESRFAELAEKSGGDIARLTKLIAQEVGADPIELKTEANTEGVKEDVDAAKAEAESDSVNIQTDADTAPAEKSTKELKDKVESEPVTQTVEVKTEAQEDATSTTDEKTATVKVSVDDADATAKLEELIKERTVSVRVAADEASVQAAVDAINSGLSGAGVMSTASVDTKGATSSIDALNKKIGSISKTTTTKVSASVTGKEKVDALQKSLSAVAKSWKASLSVSVSGSSEVKSLLDTLSRNNGKKYSVTFDTYRVTHNITKDNARGGMFDPNRIPRHADGIFTRPTLTNIGWVGEDGAELYSGNSLVPLTNRKYSMPYINDISDAVAKKIGPVSAGNQITVTVTGVSGPDEVADAIARRLSMLNL